MTRRSDRVRLNIGIELERHGHALHEARDVFVAERDRSRASVEVIDDKARLSAPQPKPREPGHERCQARARVGIGGHLERLGLGRVGVNHLRQRA